MCGGTYFVAFGADCSHLHPALPPLRPAHTRLLACMPGLGPCRSVSCCFTCPYQPVCAVCNTPCNPVFDRIEVIPGVLPTQPSEVQSLSYSYTSSTDAVNRGSNAQTITVTFAIAQALTVTMQYAEAFQYSQKTSLKVLPACIVVPDWCFTCLCPVETSTDEQSFPDHHITSHYTIEIA